MGRRVIIVGGVAAGATAAARLRRLDEQAEIIILERGEYVSFANCGLPYHVGDIIPERRSLLIHTPSSLKARFNIDVRIKNEVTSIDRDNRQVEVKDHVNGEIYSLNYDILVLATGSSPVVPPIKGINSPNVFTLWNIPDMDRIKTYISQYRPETAAVVGGGFIGLETAENLHQLGIKVTIIEKLDQVLAHIDYEMAEMVHSKIEENNVELITDDGVGEFASNGNLTKIKLLSGKINLADMVILSIGVKPNSGLAKDAGLAVNERGAIVVDEYLRTSDKNIYAIGDVIEVTEFVSKNKTMIPLAGLANKQGRICADNICGREQKYTGAQGTSVIKVFDLTVAATGLNEKTLTRAGKQYRKDYMVAVINDASHSRYYPGSMPMMIKLIFDLKGKILGAQIVGQSGVDKRIDIIATCIRFGGAVSDLTQLELGYAPPYSSAKDPVNMVGYVAENILRNLVDFVLISELDDVMKQGEAVILDVKEAIERRAGFIEGSVHIPLSVLRSKLNMLDREKTIIVYCVVGLRAYIAVRILLQKGFKARVLSGGHSAYSMFNYRRLKGRPQ